MGNLTDKRVLITGVGLKPVRFVFKDITTGRPSHTAIVVDAKEFKANIGAATALECAKAGAIVHLVARTEKNLTIVKQWIESIVADAKVEFTATDLGDRQSLKRLVESIPRNHPLYWVQSVGLGAGTIKLKDDNPYLPIDEIPEGLVDAELSVLKNTITLLQSLLPRFRQQEETRVCIISSMSAVRSFASGSIHNAAKGAISRFANAAMIELDHEKIFVTDIRPGGVDTGMYDSEVVQKTVQRISKDFNYPDIHYIPPSAVGQAIVNALSSDAHITSINMVGKGQWPHEGS
ncbi:MAG: SDR family oxidoreductase [Patescibacteria group bacterium]